VTPQTPDLGAAVHIEQLVTELERDCPLSLPQRLDGERRRWIHLWQLPVDLPLKGGSDAQAVPLDLTPLQRLYDGHFLADRPRVRWHYRYYYFELLARERRLLPAFWIEPDQWALARGVCRKLLHPRPGRSASPAEWRQHWERLVAEGVVQTDPPSLWLDMLQLDSALMAEYGWFHESLRFAKVPVYMGVAPADVRRCMREDLGPLVLNVPTDAGDVLARWRTLAERLGMPQVWPTAQEQRLEQRKAYVLALLRDRMVPAQVAERLVAEDLHPIRRGRHDASYDAEDRLESARRRVYAIIDQLVDEGEITKDQIARRPRGRPTSRPE